MLALDIENATSINTMEYIVIDYENSDLLKLIKLNFARNGCFLNGTEHTYCTFLHVLIDHGIMETTVYHIKLRYIKHPIYFQFHMT